MAAFVLLRYDRVVCVAHSLCVCVFLCAICTGVLLPSTQAWQNLQSWDNSTLPYVANAFSGRAAGADTPQQNDTSVAATAADAEENLYVGVRALCVWRVDRC